MNKTSARLILLVAVFSLIASGLSMAIASPPTTHPGGGKPSAHPGGGSTNGHMKLFFKVQGHQLTLGDAVTGTVRLVSKGKHGGTPVAGATVTLNVFALPADHASGATPAATQDLVTGADGKAAVSWSADADGTYKLVALYAGERRTLKKVQVVTYGAEASPSPSGSPTESPEPSESPGG